MKKFFSLFLMMFLLLGCLAGCASKDSITIDRYEWELSKVITLENEKVVLLATVNEREIAEGAKKIDITLTAKDGIITVTDHANNLTYSGTYKKTRSHPKGTDYEITIDGKEGYAGVAMTTYADGSQVPTLPISLGEYTLQLYAKS